MIGNGLKFPISLLYYRGLSQCVENLCLAALDASVARACSRLRLDLSLDTADAQQLLGEDLAQLYQTSSE